MTLATLRKRRREVEAAFHAFDTAFPHLKSRADAAGADRDRDTLFRAHALLRAELRELEDAIARKEGTP